MGDTTTDVISGDITTIKSLLTNDVIDLDCPRCGKLSMWYATNQYKT